MYGVGTDHDRADGDPPLRVVSNSVGAIVRGYKSAVTKQINTTRQTHGYKVWQRNYYEQIIRTDESLNKIRDYILNNPLNWNR